MHQALKFILHIFAGSLLACLSLNVFADSNDVATTKAQVQKLIPTLEIYLQKSMKDWKVPGLAIGIIVGDELVYAKGFGVRRMGTNQPVDKNTLFPIGSTTKAFTSALMAVMVDKNKMKWTDRVIDWYPTFQLQDSWATREFQVGELMAQHSGLPPYAVSSVGLFGFDREHIIHALRYIEPISSFRSTFAYQNGFFLLAGMIMAKAADLPSWEKTLQKHLLDPLEMKNTSMSLQELYRTNNFATGTRFDESNSQVSIFEKQVPMSYMFGPAGGINSNITDMSKWLIMQVNSGRYNNKQIISAANLKHTWLPETKINDEMYYALGWLYKFSHPYNIILHPGDTPGVHSMVAIVPQKKVGIVILSNTEALAANYVVLRFFDMLFGNPEIDYSHVALEKLKAVQPTMQAAEKKPVQPRPAYAFSNYIGTYHNGALGDAQVSLSNNQLHLTMGPRPEHASLEHFTGNIFVTHWTGILAGIVEVTGNKVEFEKFINDNGDLTQTAQSMVYYQGGRTFIFNRIVNRE